MADVSSAHDGSQARAEGFYVHRSGNWAFRPSIGVVYTSDDYVDYYYGVEQNEAIPTVRAAYEGDSELSYRASLIAMWNPGGSNWQVLMGGLFDAYGDEIDDSPIVDDSTMFTGIVALGYRF
jgi:outer membrane protein